MRRTAAALAVIAALLTGGRAAASTAELDPLIEEAAGRIIDSLDLDGFRAYASGSGLHEMFGYSDPEEFLRDMLTGDVNLSASGLWDAAVALISRETGGLLALVAEIIVLAALCGLLDSSHSSLLSSGMRQSAFMVIYLALGALLIKTFFTAVSESSGTISSLVGFMNTSTPVMMVLLALNGGALSSAALSPVLLFMCNLITYLIDSFIVPVMGFSYVISFASNLLEGVDVSAMSSFIRKSAAVVLGLCFTVFSAVLVIEGAAFSAVDGAGTKAVKYAAKNLIPVIGGFLSDSYDTLSGFVGVIKNSVGLLGCIVILCLALAPVVRMLAVYLALKLASIAVQPFTEKRFSSFVETTASSLLFVNMSVAVTGFMFVVITACLMLIGGSGALGR